MRVGLVSYKFKNNDINFNISQIKKACEKVKGKVDFIVFGEAFLQGFDGLTWKYEIDKNIAVSQDSKIISDILTLSKENNVDIVLCYLEKDNDKIYSSAFMSSDGKIIHNYRRISEGWKEVSETDEHYIEGEKSESFIYKNNEFKIALCGDGWLYPEKYKTDGILIWPIYVNFSLDLWETEKVEYAKHAYSMAEKTLLVNSLSDEPKSYGGAFLYENGKIKEELGFDKEDILVVEI